MVIDICHKLLLTAAALILAAITALPAAAQSDTASVDAADAADVADDASDPPSRAARLSYVEGSASLQPAGIEDWNGAPVNQPLTAGDALWIDSGSRAEIDLGTALVRLDERSNLAVVDLNDRTAQFRLGGGTLDISLNALDSGQLFEIDAPNAAVALLQPGEYRLAVDNAGNTSIVVRSGQAQVQSGDDQGTRLSTGQRGLFAANGSYALLQASAPDDFDRWCQQRQAHWADEQAEANYVSTDVVGYEDLQDYGQWQQQPSYGYVWFPTQVAADWAPYSVGHWIWVAPWGWTWVDDAPWGYAPFHYGRWTHIGRRWGWVPAPPHRRAIYAPALVAWIGGPHAGGSVSLGGGSAVGWLPLAPGEVFVPAYRVTPRYLQNVNMSNTIGLNVAYIGNVSRNPALQNRYANRDLALTVIPQNNFIAGQPVQRHRVSAPPQFQSAQPTPRAPGIVPERESVLGAFSLSRIGHPPQTVLERTVTVHRPLPPAMPSFEQQRSAIQANGGHPLDAAQLRSLRGPEPARIAPAPAASIPAATAPGATAAHRGIPERAPQFQPPAQALGPNVFQQRDRELQQQRDAELRAQAQQQQQRRAQQQLLQQQPQQPQQIQPQRQSPPQLPRQTAPSPPPPPVQRPNPDVRRPSGPLTPSEQR